MTIASPKKPCGSPTKPWRSMGRILAVGSEN